MKYSILILIILPVTIHAQTFNIRHDIKKLKIAEKGAFQSVDYTGELNVSALDNRIDQPDIPVYLYKIALDPSETVKSFTIKNVVEQRLDGTYNIQPQRELWHQDLEESPPQFNLKYEQKIYPTQVIKFLGVKHFNGIPIAHFAIYPLKYEPENQALIFVEGLDLILQTVKDEAEEISPIKEFKYENYNLTDLVQNNKSRTIKSVPMSVSDWTRDEYGIPIDYLNAGMIDQYVIITTESLKSSFKPLAEWKNKRGVPTVIRSIQWIKENFPNGVDDAERVRNFIRWSYKNRGTKYVLLGGDTELVPTRIIETGGYTFPADYYFADLDGTWNADQDNIFGEADDLLDGYPEVYISRTPVSTPNDITRFIGRLLRYEKMENIENPDFPGDVLYTAANLNKDGDSKELILKQIDPEINPSFRRTLITETDNIGSDPGPAMAELNKDYALIFTEGHGLYHTIRPGAKGSNLYNYMIGGLTNHDPGIWYVASCWTNDIAKRSLAEMYLLAEKGGGVAYIGNSSYEYPFSGIYLQKEFYNLLFSQNRYHLAEAHFLSRLKYLGYLSWEGPSRIVVYSTIVLGDAEMPVWTEMPESLDVNFSQSDSTENYTLDVTVKEKNSSANVPGATVVLYREGEIFYIAKTNENGTAQFDLNNYSPGTASLTVSKHNYIPVEDSIEIFNNHGLQVAVDSTFFFELDGNEDEHCEPGEHLSLNLRLLNAGMTTSSDTLMIEFSGENHFISLDSNKIYFTDSISAHGIADLTPVPFRVSQDIVSDTTFLLVGTMTSSEGSFVKFPIPIPVKLPDIQIAGYEIAEDNGGKELNLSLKNTGTGGGRGINAILQTQQNWITLTDSLSVFGDIKSGEVSESQPAFKFESDGIPDSASFIVLVTDFYGKQWQLGLNFDIPSPPGNTSFLPVSPNAIELHWAPSGSSDIAGYEIFRKKAGEQNFTSISDVLIGNAGYFVDHHAETNQKYQYLIRAIDSSGNYSSFTSDTITAWPAAIAQDNFPVSIGVQAIGSDMNGLVVCDFNGDQQQEIVASGAHGVLKILNSRGEEIHSFTSLSGNLTVPAIGNLFGDARNEIVVSTKEEKTENNFVYVIDPIAGTIIYELPLGYHVPGSVMLNDLDHDGYDEIMILTHANNSPVPPQNSRLIIWSYDGTHWGPFNNWTQEGYAFEYTYSLGMPASGSLNGDDSVNVIVGTAEGKVYVFNPLRSAEPVWIRTLSGMLNGPVSLADADRDGKLEIMVPAVDKDVLYVLDDDGTDFPGWEGGKKLQLANPWYWGSPGIFANVDDDEQLELIYVGRDSAYVFETDGTNKPGWPVPIENGDDFYDNQHEDISVGGSPVVADLDQNGILEIVCITTDGLIHALDAKTAREIIGFPVNTHNDEVSCHTPFITDLDFDNDLEVLFLGHGGEIYAWDAPFKYEGQSKLFWNQAFGNLRHTGELDTTIIGISTELEKDVLTQIPSEFYLKQNYPNPFNPVTTIEFGLPVTAEVDLEVFNILGQKVISVFSGNLKAGIHEIQWNGKNSSGYSVASGVYFYRLSANNSATRKKQLSRWGKMILLK